jgi:hypothetical protein
MSMRRPPPGRNAQERGALRRSGVGDAGRCQPSAGLRFGQGQGRRQPHPQAASKKQNTKRQAGVCWLLVRVVERVLVR